MSLFDLAKPLVAAAARHVVSGVAGALVTLGAVQSNQSAQFVDIATGIVVWLAGYAWSAWQKRKQEAAKGNAYGAGVLAQAAASGVPVVPALDPALY